MNANEIIDIKNNIFYQAVHQEWEPIEDEIAPCKVELLNYPQTIVFGETGNFAFYRFGENGKLYATFCNGKSLTWEKLALIFQQAYLTVQCPSTFTGITPRSNSVAKEALGIRYIDNYNYYMLKCK